MAFFTDLTRKIGVFRCKFYSPKKKTNIRYAFQKAIHFYNFPHTYIQCSSIKCSSQFKYFITTRHFMWTEQKITMQLNFTFFTFIKSNANQSCLFWNIHVAPKTMFKGNNSCILLYKIQRCWFLSFSAFLWLFSHFRETICDKIK